jgi:hypothetical protein
MKKSAHQIWKESKEQNLSKEEFKEKLIENNVIISIIKIEDFYNKLFRTKGNNTDYKINKFDKENVKITWFETSNTLYPIADALKYISNGEWILKSNK